MSKLRILVDMDDVLECFLDLWLKQLNARYERNVTKSEIDNWDISLYYPGLSKPELYAPLNDDNFWSQLEVKNEARYYLERLMREGHEVFVLTATYYKSVPAKFEWLLNNFPFLRWEQVIISSHKQLVKGDVLIDDAPHNLVGGEYKKILFHAPHNKNFDEKTIGAIRVFDWEDVYYAIKEIEGKEK